MHHTRDLDEIGAALVDLMSWFSGPQRDEALLREARVSIDRALFPLLVRLAMGGPASVAGLAAQVGRDHTTVSRQLGKLESLGLIERQGSGGDLRVRPAAVTTAGEAIVEAITAARRRLLSKVLADWTDADRATLASVNRRLVEALSRAVSEKA